MKENFIGELYSANKLGRNIKFIMKQRGISIKALSSEMDVSETSVNNWISGKALPWTGKLPRIANFLGCNIDDLFCIGIRAGVHVTFKPEGKNV